MSIFSQILLFSVLSGVLSLLGGVVLLGRPDWVRRFAVHLISFAAGVLLAVAFLDLLPEAATLSQDQEKLFAFTLFGVILFFFLEHLVYKFHAHYYEEPGEPHGHATPVLLSVGDAVHNFVDGVIITSTFLVSPALGVVSALAVAAHELPQEISDFGIMLYHGWRRSKIFWTNLVISLANVLGALVTFLAREQIEPALPLILAFTAGIFIYIAASDLLPEISLKARDKPWHVLTLVLLGIAATWWVGQLLT